jgi:hypothetical protein
MKINDLQNKSRFNRVLPRQFIIFKVILWQEQIKSTYG